MKRQESDTSLFSDGFYKAVRLLERGQKCLLRKPAMSENTVSSHARGQFTEDKLAENVRLC